MKNKFTIGIITVALITLAVSEDCDKCVRKEKCLPFGKLDQMGQDAWIAKYPCINVDTNERSKVFGFDPIAKGDFVCCSDSIWGITGTSKPAGTMSKKTPAVGVRRADYNNDYGNPNNDNPNNNNNYQSAPTPPNNYFGNNANGGNNGWGADQYGDNGGTNNAYNPNQGMGNNGGSSNTYDSNQGNGNNGVTNTAYDPNQGNGNNGGYNTNAYQPTPGNPSYGYNTPPKNYLNTNNNNAYATPNPYFHANTPTNNQGHQCPVTSFPPSLQSGCCGREATDSDRIIGRTKATQPTPAPTIAPSYNYGYTTNDNDWRPSPRVTQSPPSYNQMSWPSWIPRIPNFGLGLNRVARSIDDNRAANISIRIIGGHETEFTQFPWTVLLKITFDYGNRRAAFNCGGSLISSRYVLTAGHCVYDKGGTVVDLDIYLAEYDKRTFPEDCKIVPGEGRKCITNIVMKADRFTLHPQYEDSQLKNDIALIRLKGIAPYTDYIRPICLPSIDVDTPEFFNLRLAVAGWGRNGRFRSDVKQSTVVNLIPEEQCRKSYPAITNRNLCAAGYTGEDTCKGDSGGPLMTLYGGKYEVVGVVSGKRADAPCGNPVPSLYTNVYHYLDWIRSNIRN